jgi:hypothetical protein
MVYELKLLPYSPLQVVDTYTTLRLQLWQLQSGQELHKR